MTEISIPYYGMYGRPETIVGTLVTLVEGVGCFKGEGAAKRPLPLRVHVMRVEVTGVASVDHYVCLGDRAPGRGS